MFTEREKQKKKKKNAEAKRSRTPSKKQSGKKRKRSTKIEEENVDENEVLESENEVKKKSKEEKNSKKVETKFPSKKDSVKDQGKKVKTEPTNEDIHAVTSSTTKIMPHYIPFHVQEDIIKMLPVKSLLRCRSVSKSWKSLIDSSEFVAHTLTRQTNQQHHFMLWYEDVVDIDEIRYVSVVDDDVTFTQQKYVPDLPLSITLLHDPIVPLTVCYVFAVRLIRDRTRL
ncbi:uncharacterized protein [Rutidosis leptorrhynchoides]|uniref:uncharacterized protein n=1 Tax=Rutidosis leptorrhynchoides TaxID=125765 RepID=UPI003A9A55B1